MATPQVRACLFDMDGLLLDTETIYSEVTNKILEPFNKTFPMETKLKMMGRDVRTATEILLADLQLPMTFEEYDQQATALKKEYFRKTAMMPGAARLIEHLVNHGVPIAVATSSAKSMFLAKTESHRALFDLFGTNVTCGDDPEVARSKPAPDIFLTAMRRLDSGLQAADCLVFEDAENGVDAASNACMHSVWVQDTRFTAPGQGASAAHGATERITTLLEFDPTKYGLPPFEH
ncbi:hypothetical protein H4R21_002759 [Coemansia helicoidea]|uniref:Uncharacterized protein n=1 Tax=Coemansia helicoidea TaxID=1286919 RepID=A0ACC1L5A9_9FUNG|nr:hypothetical protein H4R21_002759 [Coemansia helicoidea]